GGAWDNAKKVVETELKAKGTDLHAATVVGDTVGDPFKDTSSVAMNPVIKFTTLFGLLAVELAVSMKVNGSGHKPTTVALALAFFIASMFFVWRSFYRMQIGGSPAPGGQFETAISPRVAMEPGGHVRQLTRKNAKYKGASQKRRGRGQSGF